jgi:hypothetical protein
MVATAAVEGAVGRQTRRFGRGITLPACAAPMANSLLRRTVLRLESQVATAADGPKPVGRNVGPAGAGMYWAGLWARPGVVAPSRSRRRTVERDGPRRAECSTRSPGGCRIHVMSLPPSSSLSGKGPEKYHLREDQRNESNNFNLNYIL